MLEEHARRYRTAVVLLATGQGCSLTEAVELIDLAVLELDEPAAHIASYVRTFGELP